MRKKLPTLWSVMFELPDSDGCPYCGYHKAVVYFMRDSKYMPIDKSGSILGIAHEVDWDSDGDRKVVKVVCNGCHQQLYPPKNQLRR